MPFATNPLDGGRIYYEDDDGCGVPIVLMGGFATTVVATRLWPVAQAMGPEYRHIYIDQRGHGQSEKPRDVSAYAIEKRVADVVAVLDELSQANAHLVAASFGARLALNVAARAPDRVASVTACGMTPGKVSNAGPVVGAVERAMRGSDGMEAFVRELSAFMPIEGRIRDRMMENDHAALAACWSAHSADTDLSDRLSDLSMPCLLCVGTDDADFYEAVKRDAPKLPNSTVVEMSGKTHFSGLADDSIVPRIKQHIEAAS
jgi:pimeloyl-ACP methyl ester carboxylesterase